MTDHPVDDDPQAERPRVVACSLGELTPLEVHELYKLRVDVFVAEQDCPYAEIDDTDADPATVHLLAWLPDDAGAQRLAATIRLFQTAGANAETGTGGHPEPVWHIGRVCTHPEFRHRGLAAELIRQGLGITGDQPVEIGAQAYLERWYEGFGFARSGPNYLDERIEHLPMRRVPESAAVAPS